MGYASGLRAMLPCGTFAAAALAAPAAVAQESHAELLAEMRQMRARMNAQETEIEALRARVDAQSAALARAGGDPGPKPAAQAMAAPATASGVSPEFRAPSELRATPESKDGEWQVKLFGRMMYDVGYVQNPSDAIPSKNLGFNSRLRRARLGVEGKMPAGFAYKAEADFASGEAEWADIYLEWKPGRNLALKIGHFNSFQSMEQPTSSRHITLLERAQFVEAYSQARRLGGAAIFSNDRLYLAGGLFNEGVNDSFNNDGWLFAARAAFMPELGPGTGGTQLHLGANFQHRAYNSSKLGARYRARPNGRFSDISFIDTGTIAADGDSQWGVEAFAIRGPWHLGGEASWLRVNAIGPDDLAPGDSIPADAIIASGNPGFFGYYLETGYFLTGETRGYKKSAAMWDRTRVKAPLGGGGIGLVSANLRWDSMNLNHRAIQRGGVNTGSSRGGRNNALSFNIIWQPIDFVRITTQYTLMNVKGGPFALRVNDLPDGDATGESYKVNLFGTRFAYEF